jgi:predicted O-methyltransferase YrrM
MMRELKRSYRLGTPFSKNFRFPEVFYQTRPTYVPSPWTIYTFRSQLPNILPLFYKVIILRLKEIRHFLHLLFIGYPLFIMHRIADFLVGIRDKDRLITDLNLYGFDEKFRLNKLRLKKPYVEYNSTVSSSNMTISLETAAFLLTFCEYISPRMIIDLGSGFSSFVFLSYANNKKNCRVIIVDDSDHWLMRTKNYVKEKGFKRISSKHWSVFRKKSLKGDLVFYDLGTMETRVKYLQEQYKFLTGGSHIVIDDVHFPEYKKSILKFIKTRHMMFYSLYKVTRDEFGRYSAVVTKGLP